MWMLKGRLAIEKSSFICQIKALPVYSRNNQVDAQKDVKTQDYPQRPRIKGRKCQKHTFVASSSGTSSRCTCPFDVDIFTLVALLLLNPCGQMQGDLWMVGQGSQKYQERQACAYTSNHHWTPLRIEAKHAHYVVFLAHLQLVEEKAILENRPCMLSERRSQGSKTCFVAYFRCFFHKAFFHLFSKRCIHTSAIMRKQFRCP